MEKGRLEEQVLELHKLKVEIQEQSRLITSLKQACAVSYIYTVKPVRNGLSKTDKTKILITVVSVMKIESIVECSTFDLH